MLNKNIAIRKTYVFILIIICSNIALGSIHVVDLAEQFKSLGFSVDTTPEIIAITKFDNYVFRYMALELLTQRIGKDAIPMLKDALEDPEWQVQHRAAQWLGEFGDKSGLEPMRNALRAFAPSNDFLSISGEEDIEETKKRKHLLSQALDAVRVLAELGDCRGYELASRIALSSEPALALYKTKTIFALVSIAKNNEKKLRADGIDPVFVLSVMAESETNMDDYTTITARVDAFLSPEAKLRVFEAGLKSRHLSEEERKLTKLRIKNARANKNAVPFQKTK